MRTIEFNRLRLFARVVEAGSFTAAARDAGLPKSSVSRAIAALERDLAVRLIHRTTRRLQPTEAGRAYYESVSRALAGIDEATAAVSELQDTPRGTVRLTAPTDLGDRLLPPILVSFAARYPEVRVDVVLTQRFVDLVHEGVDIALRVGRLGDSRLVARPLGPVRAGVFASPRYLERRGVPRTVAVLAEHECVLFQSSSGRAVWRLVGPRGAETVEVRGAISADDHHMVREAAAAGQASRCFRSSRAPAATTPPTSVASCRGTRRRARPFTWCTPRRAWSRSGLPSSATRSSRSCRRG